MKLKPLLSVIVLLVALAFCSKDGYMSDGTIIGPDVRMCACCGGWFIDINSVTWEFESLPSGSDIDLDNETFPLNVRLNWKLSDREACPDKYITILRITR